MAQPTTRGKCEEVIDRNLKRVYDETLDEGVPDRFQALLDALRKQEQRDGSSV